VSTPIETSLRYRRSLEDFLLPFEGQFADDTRLFSFAEPTPCDNLKDYSGSQTCDGFGAPIKSYSEWHVVF